LSFSKKWVVLLAGEVADDMLVLAARRGPWRRLMRRVRV
jgi:hypothetical protein